MPKKRISLLELALKLNTTKSKLQYYAKEGLIKYDEKVGNMRCYDEEKVTKRLTRIIELQKKGFTLEEIKLKLK